MVLGKAGGPGAWGTAGNGALKNAGLTAGGTATYTKAFAMLNTLGDLVPGGTETGSGAMVCGHWFLD